MRSVALDLSATAIEWAEAADGEVVNQGKVGSLGELQVILGDDPARVAFEACRESWYVHAVLEGWGHQPVMLDTTRIAMVGVGHHGRKNDRLDAEAMALALDRGIVPEAHVLSTEAHELRELQEMHRALTDTRKRLVTHVRGILRGRGIKAPSCGTEKFAANMTEAELPPALHELVQPLLQTLQALEPQLAEVDLRLAEALTATAERSEVATRLSSMTGVSLIVAGAYISVIDDPNRFDSPGQVSSYLGLCPREKTTGYRQKMGSITKHGNGYARAMLLQGAWAVIRSRDTSDPLVRWAHRKRQQRGSMRAAVAVARRMSRILWAMWHKGTVYDPAHLASASARGKRDEAKQAGHEQQALEQASKQAVSRKRGEEKLRRQRRKLQRAAARQTA